MRHRIMSVSVCLRAGVEGGIVPPFYSDFSIFERCFNTFASM